MAESERIVEDFDLPDALGAVFGSENVFVIDELTEFPTDFPKEESSETVNPDSGNERTADKGSQDGQDWDGSISCCPGCNG